jgi:hypothetical protein
MDRQVRFYRLACDRCLREGRSGYTAGAFMLGRFVNTSQPVALWRALTPERIAVLVNEWILFLKYLDVLQHVGERRLNRARKQILQNGLRTLALHARGVKTLMSLKLSGRDLSLVLAALPPWSDPQSAELLRLLGQPYHMFYDYDAPWSFDELKRLCARADLPVPAPGEC